MRILTAALAATLLLAATVASPQLYSRGSAPGEQVADTRFVDLDGRAGSLQHPGAKAGSIVIVRDIECPVFQRYLPRIVEIAKRYGARGYGVIVLDMTPHGKAEAKKASRALPGTRTVLEGAKQVALALRAETTAEVFVIDRSGTLRYRGAIDDQYGIDFQHTAVTAHWLRDALERIAAGEAPQISRTSAHGCPLALDLKPQGQAVSITYNNRISRILQSRCQACHREGGLAPMPLENFRQVHERRAVIQYMVEAGRMPPWSAHKDIGEFANDRSLSERERTDLLGWIKAGALEGDPKDAPNPRRFMAGWNIGKPDYVVALPKPFRVPAQGGVGYQNFYIKTDLSEDKWVTAIEIKPTQAKVVHHALAYLEAPGLVPIHPDEEKKLKPGDAKRLNLPHNGVNGFYAATVPGSLGITFPDGMGKKLPKGAWIKLEIHYQPNGTDLIDQTQIGFRFSKKPLREVESLSAFNHNLLIPPNNPRFEMKAEHAFEESGLLLSLFPHMHFRGSAFRYDLRYPDGRVVPVLSVPKFDFSWQSYYQLARPIAVPKGATLLVTAWYDNSKANPWNPDPNRAVPWGLQTTDEMMIGYFDFSPDPKPTTSAGSDKGK